MSTTIDDILTKVNELNADSVVVDWSGDNRKLEEVWKLILTNRPEETMSKLRSHKKASFKLEDFNHAERIAEQISERLKISNEFVRPSKISEDNLYLVVEIIYN